MADNKMGPNLQAGAGIFAKRVQKSLNRAQEKVLQKLGKTMETKDEQFELCSQNLNKQQMDGSRLFKDVKAYYSAVKAVHETSKRLSTTLKDVYESDWNGVEDLAVITDSEDLLWNDYEEKLNDQIVRTMDNYTGQFAEVKERVAKRGRKLVDYDSARHHLEALQNAKKKDDGKIAKAEEEFNKAQNVFEEINNELREELPVLYQSRIGCYVTVFQNMSNLRDVFYKEMSVLNRELYNVMKKLETQHSGKAFIIKGLNSTSGKSKKRKSLIISNPIPCNTAFPADHVSVHSSTQNGKDTASSTAAEPTHGVSENSLPEQTGSESSSKDVHTSDSDLSSSGSNTPKRQSAFDDRSHGPEGAGMETETGTGAETGMEAELISDQSDDSGVGVHKSKVPSQEVSVPSDSADSDGPQSPEQEDVAEPELEEPKPQPGSAPEEPKPEPAPEEPKPEPASEEPKPEPAPEEPKLEPAPEEPKPKPGPVPAPRISFRVTDNRPVNNPSANTDNASEDNFHNPPGFSYKAVAVQTHAVSEDGLLQFDEGDVILVLSGTAEDGLVKGIREETWNQHQDLQNHWGLFSEKLVQPME